MTNLMQRNILLNPGPVTTTDTVKQSLVVPDICHREVEFTHLLKQIRQDLLRVHNASDQYTSILFCGSGTGAIEACLTSAIPKDKKIAVINNGAYGKRMLQICERYHIPTVSITLNYDEPIDLSAIESLVSDPNVYALAMVHHETSSGILNPLTEIGEICHQHDTQFIVDAMSSFAGTDINLERDHIDYIMASSNKCLHGMPGIGFVIAKKQSLASSKGSARSFYFDMHQQYEALESSGQMAFTPPVQTAYALQAALTEFFEAGGYVARMKAYHTRYDHLTAGLKALGFKILTPDNRQSKILAVVQFPSPIESRDFDELHDELFEQGFTIYPAKFPLPGSFRLACIGNLDLADIDAFLKAVKQYIERISA